MKKDFVAMLFVIVVGSFLRAAMAQELAITKDGQRVILFANGTWKFESALDSTEKANIGQTISVPTAVVEIIPPVPPKPKPPRVYSLECSSLVDVERDITSDSYVAVSKSLRLLKEDSTAAFSFSMMKSKKSSLMWTIRIPGKPCITAENKILIVLKDGVRYTLQTDSKPNCDGEFKVFFGNLNGKDVPLQSLKETEISSVRVFTAKGYVDSNFDEENAKKLKAAMNCMAKNL